MKSWGIIVIVAVGFGAGILAPKLAIEMGISAASTLQQTKNVEAASAKDSAKVEQYWNKTQIELSDLKKYVNNTKCYSAKKEFLACINSVLFALQKTNYYLKLDGTITENDRKENKLDNYNEKQNLVQYTNLYSDGLANKFNFDHLWETVLSKSSESTVSYKMLLASGINGYLSVAVDPHTYISPTNFFKEVSSSNERSKLFLGLSFEKKSNKIVIRKVFKNSDADIAGLENNDEVISINGKNVEEMNLSEVSNLLKDKSQKTFPFVVRRNEAVYIKKLNRTYRVLSQVQSEVITNGNRIGYIQLSKFAYDICDNVKSEIEKMKPSTLNGLVLDLRDNPGGLLSEAACLAGLFIGENKKIFSVKYLNENSEEVALTTSKQIYFGPMVILTNSASASASELIAGSMQEYNRATIVGEKTFGKGSFQEIEKWNKSSDISFFSTKGFYLLPSGETTQLKGVTPDVVLSSYVDSLGESALYEFPLNYKADQKAEVLHKEMYKKSNLINNCNGSAVKAYSNDQFISKAQQILGCEIALSAKVENKNENISL